MSDLIVLYVNLEEFYFLEQLVSQRMQQLSEIEKSGGYENKIEKRLLTQWQDKIEHVKEKQGY